MEKDYFMNAGIPPPRPLRFESSMPISDHSFLNTNSTMDQFSNLDSSWSSMFSSSTTTTTTTTALSADAFALREFIGTAAASSFANSSNLPSSTSPKLTKLPILDQINLPSLASSAALSPPIPAFSTDPGFAERAAKFSSLGSRSFNGDLTAEAKLPSLKQNGSLLPGTSPSQQQVGMRPVNGVIQGSDKKLAGSMEESSDSEQVPSGEAGSMMNSRKRKAITRGKNMEGRSNSSKRDDDKRSKPTENGEKAEEECKGGSNDESNKNQKPPEPLKDYIHVRARRGQATDSHSLAERVRREKISERMKLLQDLVPGCNKVTGKAVMLDEIINYVQSLQRQVEFLSMKLASVNPALDFNIENLLSKDMFQRNTMPKQLYPLDSSSYHNQNVQQQQLHCTNISSRTLSQSSVDPLPFDRFHDNLPQFAAFTEDDLHSIVQMGLVQNSVNFPVQNQTSNMKVEL